MKYAFPHMFYNIGYGPLRQEVALLCRHAGPDGENVADEKEFYMMGPKNGDRHDPLIASDEFNFENVWPKEVPDFSPAMRILYEALYPIGLQVLRVLEPFLDLPAGAFKEMTHGGPTVMRALHYPPLSAEDIGKVVWGCKHRDVNFVTVLPRSTQSGLWIRHRYSGDFILGQAPDGCVIVQTGDMLRSLTHGRLASAVHEVRAPSAPTTVGRLSAALFLHPRSEVDLGNGKTAGQFLKERLAAIGLGPNARKVY